MVEMKIAAAKMLAKYRFTTTPETKMDLLKGDLFLISYPEMKLKLEERE